MPLIFEWDPGKAERNRKKHGMSFEKATTVFRDTLSSTISLTTGGFVCITEISRLNSIVGIINHGRDGARPSNRWREYWRATLRRGR